MTHSGAVLLPIIDKLALAPLIENGQYLMALNRLRQELVRVRGEGVSRGPSLKAWRNFCADNFHSHELADNLLINLLSIGPFGQVASRTKSREIHHPEMLDAIYGLDPNPKADTAALPALRDWELELGFCLSLRSRCKTLAYELSEVGTAVRYPRILAVGCGHLREAAAALSRRGMDGGEFVAYDPHPAAVSFIEHEYDHQGLRILSGAWPNVLKNELDGSKFDLIYLPTLLDELDDKAVSELLIALLAMLEPGGRLLAANFAPDLQDAAYLEAWLDWWPFYRGEEELAAIVSRIAGSNLRGQAVFREDSGGSVFVNLEAL
jgi:hypothetical protein